MSSALSQVQQDSTRLKPLRIVLRKELLLAMWIIPRRWSRVEELLLRHDWSYALTIHEAKAAHHSRLRVVNPIGQAPALLLDARLPTAAAPVCRARGRPICSLGRA